MIYYTLTVFYISSWLGFYVNKFHISQNNYKLLIEMEVPVRFTYKY